MAVFEFEGQSLAYTEFGGGPAALAAGGVRGRTARSAAVSAHPLILLHGLLATATFALVVLTALVAWPG